MPAEAAFSFNARNSAGEQITLRGDSWSEFRGNVVEMFGGDVDVAEEFLGRFVLTAKAAKPSPTVEQATQNIQNAMPGTTVVGSDSAAANSGDPQPGELRVINGVQKKWVPAGISKKTNRPYKGFWGNVQ